MKPLQQSSFFITRGAAMANGLEEFTAVGNSCHKDCPRVRASWYSSSLPWSHRNPHPGDAAESQKKLSASLLTGLSAQSGFYPKKKPEAQKLRLPNLEIPAQVLTPNFQIPGSLSIQLTGKQGAGTINFQKPQLRQKPLILDSQAQLCFKVM